jgi:peptidoglycan hydrolase-like protein with peptidoglycan-binding domain
VLADSVVYASPRALEDLQKNLDRYMGQVTPPDPADAVVLDERLTREVQQALRRLGYYSGPDNGVWTDAVEAALSAFQAGNVFVPKPTVVAGRVRRADGPLVRMLLSSERGTFYPAPR